LDQVCVFKGQKNIFGNSNNKANFYQALLYDVSTILNKITADFSTETLKARRAGSEVFQALKETISVLGYSTQKSYHSQSMEKSNNI
jgi:hypothetical protein